MLHSKPQVLPLAAGSSVAQIKENLEAADINLSMDQMRKLNLAENSGK
jgi:aryl-alcohol dehydrogenase-like predicted oxidoreductase